MLLLAASGRLPRLDAAIFADTGWEPAAVYRHLDRLEREVAAPAGIPVLRVSSGSIREDALDPGKRFASMPLFVRNRDGGQGMIRRQCTGEYKIKPIKRAVRGLLNCPWPQRLPRGLHVEQWIGISTDEFHRAKDADVGFMKNRFPLLDLGLSREDCQQVLRAHGFADTPKSACIGCPFHGNAQWRTLRDSSPAEWADAVAFDDAIRSGNARGNAGGNQLLGEAFLHRSRLPLDQAPIDHVTAREWADRQVPLDAEAADEWEQGASEGCSPWSCRGTSSIRDDYQQAV
ncbi:hypothetical protein GXW83_28300 [Streptacidiphilus sp. PB12-B1b]|uniref:hypothetical protein n=1 Tax=Streptacidiphilus sp. PB12-B1b TaxID=2705012 RepID=UPI0015FCD933|nr:hypothetical protein [Streptacidiphilus sp. PB12-B1b]QMU80603.1 hypothetical protein GXW83_28300 [Streptacidiphilus sp. PB12-B1b]